MCPREAMPDPRNQPDGSHDQDKHGRKPNSGSSQRTQRALGSGRDPATADLRREQARRDQHGARGT